MKFLILLVACLGIDIDAAWLSTRSEPYILDQASSTYVLKQDVTVERTAFIAGAANIDFDLGQHSIKYGDGVTTTLDNGGFENGLTGWDITKAPTAVIRPIRIGMWGVNMLTLDNFNTPQIIVSSAVTIPKANREYVATFTPWGSSGTPITLEVIDTVTGLLLVSEVTGGAADGKSGVVLFTPTTTNPIKLQITVAPPEGRSATVSLDYVDIKPARDYGIIASVGSSSNFPPHLKPFVGGNKKVANFKLRNGKIIQGKSRSFGSESMMVNSTSGVIVDGVSFFNNGMDGQHIEGLYSSDVVIRNCEFDSDIDNISSRRKIFAQIKLGINRGTVIVDNCVLKHCPQNGIALNGNVSGTVEVTNNRISQKTVVTNGYGIALRGISNFKINNNQIITTQGRGIILEAGGTPISGNGLISNNYVDVHEKPNLEYGQFDLDVQAFRVRNYDSRLASIIVEGNTFMATSDANSFYEALGARFTHDNDFGQMDNANNIIRNNTFRAINTVDDPKFKASAISFSGVGPNTGVVFENNTFESNSTAIQVGDWASPKLMNEDIMLVGSTIKKCDGAPKPFRFVYAGDTKNGCRNIKLLNTKFENGATDSVVFALTNSKEVILGTRATVHLLLGQILNVLDKDGKSLYSGDGSSVDITLRTITQVAQPAKVIMPIVITEQGTVTFKFEKVTP